MTPVVEIRCRRMGWLWSLVRSTNCVVYRDWAPEWLCQFWWWWPAALFRMEMRIGESGWFALRDEGAMFRAFVALGQED